MSIPIRNVYYLLCYAWDALQGGKQVDVDLRRLRTYGEPPGAGPGGWSDASP